MITKINGKIIQIIEANLNKSGLVTDPETGKFIKCHRCKRPMEYIDIEKENIFDDNGVRCDLVLVACPASHTEFTAAIITEDSVNRIKKRGRIKVVIVKNSELPEPYCFAEGTPEEWVGIGDYDPDKVIPGEVCCDQEGYVYTVPIGANDAPIDQDQDFDSWLEMTIDPKKYPSARLEFI